MPGSSTTLGSKKIKYDIYTVLAFNAPFVSQSWPRGRVGRLGNQIFFSMPASPYAGSKL